MTFYEQELRKLFADGTVIGSPKFTGRACLGTLGKDLRARVQFVTSGHADHYDVISVTVLNRTDEMCIRDSDRDEGPVFRRRGGDDGHHP